MEIRIFGLADDSIVDGPGVRYTVFVQGCPHHCPGCHNPASHDFAGGTLMDTDGIIRKIGENPLLDGVTHANITVRNFPLTAPQLRRRLKLKDGGSNYLFATTDAGGRHVLILAHKAPPATT